MHADSAGQEGLETSSVLSNDLTPRFALPLIHARQLIF